ncbi:(Na+)-NQR maturation NqrM [Kangiella sp. HZ709]|uniref:(Na+)-NQR maturation NqrM n=1 Tax=Kangiella sp. HZ709 TaxID=2666328 RepID=UPI00141618D8|nr:(Na+)-NQR maturation NqrM [Kangiella sp. HZ709]
MDTFLLAFILFAVVILIMAIGYIIQNKRISGSCGGLDALGIEKACDCEKPCAKKRARLRNERRLNIQILED